MLSNVRSSLIIGHIRATKEHFQRALMEHAQSRQLISVKTSERGLSRFVFSDTSDASSIGSTVPSKQGLGSHSYSLDTVKVAIMI